MADKKDNNSVLTRLMKTTQQNIDNLYKNTYLSQINNLRDLNTIKTDIDNSIDDILDSNKNKTGSSTITHLYNRIELKNKNTSNINDELEDIFDNKAISDGIISLFNENKYLKDYDNEIDNICRYMPKLVEALEVKKDNVLAADNFTKDFINVINNSNVNKEVSFNDRIDTIKKVYNLTEFLESAYDNTARYGEQFIYIVSYTKAFNRLMKQTNNIGTNESVIRESFEFENVDKRLTERGSCSLESFNIEFHMGGVLESVCKSHNNLQSVLEKVTSFDKTIDDDLKFESPEGESSEGFLDINKAKNKKINIKVPGCILKKLDRQNVIPKYIEDTCLGYYYLECEFSDVENSNNIINMTSSIKNRNRIDMSNKIQQDDILNHISSKISSFIDSKFINDNQDLKNEIYLILKHNQAFTNKTPSNIKVTFIPVEDMIHMYFNKDQNTNRGISDLDNALLPAKLYTYLYLNDTIGILTRGHDKRVFYVKNNVDTNISKVLLNTINQIKKSNYGTRELSSMKNMLNITGKFNDLVIPLSPTGDAPVNFEVMQGQNIDPKTEFLELLEEMAISATDVPYEMIQSNKMVDFAVRLTMTNGKFLRKVFKRQSKCELFFSKIITKIYNTEYDENDELDVILPPPSYLNIYNTKQMLDNVNDYVNQIIEMEMATEEDDATRALFGKKLKRHYLSTYLDTKAIDTIKDQTIMEIKQQQTKDNE